MIYVINFFQLKDQIRSKCNNSGSTTTWSFSSNWYINKTQKYIKTDQKPLLGSEYTSENNYLGMLNFQISPFAPALVPGQEFFLSSWNLDLDSNVEIYFKNKVSLIVDFSY